MELKKYFQILRRRWWIVLSIFAVTMVAAYFFTTNQPAIYETSTTFVMRPRVETSEVPGDDMVRAVDTLSRRIEINTTYAEVAKSNLIKRRATEKLDLSPQERAGLSVGSSVIAGTNVLEITVQGTDPTVVKDFANAVSAETRDYIGGLYDIFALEPLDEADIPTKPINSNMELNMIVAGILGLILGCGVAFLVEYFSTHQSEVVALNIIDFESGAYNENYLKMRLRQEMSRAKRNNYCFSLALVNVVYPGFTDGKQPSVPDVSFRRIATIMGESIRDEDILTRFENSTFALMLLDTAGEPAKQFLQELRIKMETTSLEADDASAKPYIQVKAGIVVYDKNEFDLELNELLEKASYALDNAGNATFGAINLLLEKKEDDTVYQNGHKSAGKVVKNKA